MVAKAKPGKMPKFQAASEKLVSLFSTVIEDLPEAEPRKMFGYPCAFVNGQMFVGVFQDRLMLRLSDEDRSRFLKLPGAKPFEPMPDRVMRVRRADASRPARSGRAQALAQTDLAYAKSLPPKKSKKTKPAQK